LRQRGDGTESEVLDFLNWFCNLDYRHKIFVAGNHDFCLEGGQIEGLPENCHYLCHSGVEIEKLFFLGGAVFSVGRIEWQHEATNV